ncbi:MAG: hypothetical protein ACYSYU_11655 [Planctomycetota bacterium]
MFEIEPLETESDIPDNLKSVVSNAPKKDGAIGQYLKDLVADDIITIDEATFLIESGALQN